MAMIDHWHPVLKSNELGNKPVGIQLDGHAIVLYRTRPDTVAALADECPHRRLKLSLGEVVGEKLRCRYHGWTFDCQGQGQSPGTPKLEACVTAYDTAEAFGAIWVKSKHSNPEFPRIEAPGYLPICTLRHQARAPLELALDNFSEIEHTPTTHAVFGYDLDRMAEVKVRCEPTETTVRVTNTGPCKPVGPLLHFLIGIRKGYYFNSDWTTYFSPVYMEIDHWWSNPVTARESKARWRVYVFFTPIDATQTQIMTFAYGRSDWPVGPAGGLRMFRWLMRRHLAKEIGADLDILNGLANYETSLEGMKLSRFDRVLGLNRERIERVYRGGSAGQHTSTGPNQILVREQVPRESPH
jgi:phenylpropionate dioxygenase-like ring-hydroxylating dioxygenase large terminal subunit